MKNTISGNEGRGFMKILVDAKTDTVIGVHMIGPDCAEIMQVCFKGSLTALRFACHSAFAPCLGSDYVTGVYSCCKSNNCSCSLAPCTLSSLTNMVIALRGVCCLMCWRELCLLVFAGFCCGCEDGGEEEAAR